VSKDKKNEQHLSMATMSVFINLQAQKTFLAYSIVQSLLKTNACLFELILPQRL